MKSHLHSALALQQSLRGRRKGAPAVEAEGAVVGALILNRFRVEQRLGAGGFGTVYRARDERLERPVAVKVLDVSGDVGRRVLREAQAAARLNHPGIVTLYEFGEDGRHAYLVSELVEGVTLRELSVAGELSDRDVAELGADLCEALDHAHARDVVHRDIKPQNVLVCALEARAKLMDFGVARVLGAARLTCTGDVAGTIAYMAPEQAEGEAAGAPADVYSLSLTLYECWSGQNPQARATPAATARAIGSRAPSLARRRSDLPGALTATIDACLDPDPGRRPALQELGETIEDSLEELDGGRLAPAAHQRGLPSDRSLGDSTLARLAPAAAAGGLATAAMIATGPINPVWTYALVPIVSLLSLLRPRLGYLCAAVGLTLWLGAGGREGAALTLAVLAIPPALLVSRSERALALPAAAPCLGTLGLAPIYPALAGLAGGARERLVLGAAGFAWLAVAECAFQRRLLLGPEISPQPGWTLSVGEAVGGMLVPLATSPYFLTGLAISAAAAAACGFLTRDLASGIASMRASVRRSREATLS
jgi:eukaryotic-like serine/threonine-protein kinase